MSKKLNHVEYELGSGDDLCKVCFICILGPLLLTWFNFNPSMDK